MAVTYSCDRCGFKTEKPDGVKRYTLEIKGDVPVRACTVDLCDKCIETAWKGICEQLFRTD